MPKLDSIQLDTTDWHQVERLQDGIIWENNNIRDRLYLNFFPIKPDFPVNLSEPNRLKEIHANQAKKSNGWLVEFSVGSISKAQGVKLIYKLPQQPHGMIYLASWTIPFADFSYVVKVQCHEFGTTGIREAVILDKLLADKNFDFKTDMHKVGPIADDPQYDVQFPEHPLSRARQYLRHIEQTIKIDQDVLSATPFQVKKETNPLSKIFSKLTGTKKH